MSAPDAITTWLTERIGIRYPIIQAPMAGGPTTPALVAAVGAAGALGSFGFAYTEPAGMRDQVAAARALTDAPVHINLFVEHAPDTPDEATMLAALDALSPLHERIGIAPPGVIAAPYAPSIDDQVQAALALKPALLSTHFGSLSPLLIERAHAQGTLVAASATNLHDALKLQSLGIDLIIAQGAEAGGHRGTFHPQADDAMIGTLALTRMMVRRCTVPVVAAGGIMDGEALAAVLALGACGAQLGTAFLPVDESGAPAAHQQALFDRRDDSTTITRAFSGRPARGIRNAFTEYARTRPFPLLPFPIQNKATAALRARATQQGDRDYMSLWAGQAYPLARRLSAAALVSALAEEYSHAAERLANAVRR